MEVIELEKLIRAMQQLLDKEKIDPGELEALASVAKRLEKMELFAVRVT